MTPVISFSPSQVLIVTLNHPDWQRQSGLCVSATPSQWQEVDGVTSSRGTIQSAWIHRSGCQASRDHHSLYRIGFGQPPELDKVWDVVMPLLYQSTSHSYNPPVWACHTSHSERVTPGSCRVVVWRGEYLLMTVSSGSNSYKIKGGKAGREITALLPAHSSCWGNIHQCHMATRGNINTVSSNSMICLININIVG